MDTDLISVQIQSLLNIPPIRKRDTKDGSDENSTGLKQVSSIRQMAEALPSAKPQPTADLKQRNDSIVGHSIPSKHSHRYRSQSNVETHTQLIPNANSLLGGPPPLPERSAPRFIQYPEFNKFDGRQPLQRHVNDKPNTPPTQYSFISTNGSFPRQGRSFDSSSTIAQQRPRSKMLSHMNELLRSDKCPRNLVVIKEKLIAAALEEHKPMYHLNLDEAISYLFRLHCIEPLTTKSVKFVRAKYFCFICNYHMDNITNVISHVSNSRHEANAAVHELETDVKNIPFPSFNHVTNLGFLIGTVMQNYGIDNFERTLRISLLQKLNRELEQHGLKLGLFGSSVSGFGFKTSDINFNLDLTSIKSEVTGEPLTSVDHSAKISKLAKILATFAFVSDITEGHHSLEIKFRYTEVERNCSVQVNNIAGVLLAQLFEQYNKLDDRVRYIVVAFRLWARHTGIDDQELGYLPSYAYTVMALKYLTDVGVIPHIIVSDTAQNLRTFYTYDSPQLMNWRSECHDSLGSLWLGLLRRYSVEFPFKELVISLTEKSLLKSEDKAWNKKIAIEDPIITRSNLCRTASTTKVFDYILHTIKLAFKYFGLPKLKGGVSLFEKVTPLALIRDPSQVYFHDENGPQEMKSNREERILQEPPRTIPEIWLFDVTVVSKIRFIRMPIYNGDSTKIHIIAEDLRLLDKVYTSGDYYFEFDRQIFQGGLEPPKHCRSCGKDNHVRVDCPDEVIPALSHVPYPDNVTLQVLESVLFRICDTMSLTPKESQERNALVQDIYVSLIKEFPDVELRLFGSTVNGFGLRGSDVDVAVRFTDHPVEKVKFHAPETSVLLHSMMQVLKSSGCMQDVIAIPTAKVPIIKFKHKRTRLEGDISLYNTLPLRNTELLRCYSNIDPRVKMLVCYLKQLARICDIGDASKGSLSSYAYVLMLIHYLQQLPVPVLPVLQELPTGENPAEMNDGWNTYFFSDIDCLPHHWDHYGANRDSVSKLLLGFFNYFTETFKYEEHVITINQLALLPRKDALFPASTLICIEDPFEKSHNLGAGLTRRMSVFIIKTLQRFRRIFSVSITNFLPDFDYVSYFLDHSKIRGDHNPPVDRQCRICNKIGHFANSCNFRNTNTNGSSDEAEADAVVENDEHDDQFSVHDPLSPMSDINASELEIPSHSRNDESRRQSKTAGCVSRSAPGGRRYVNTFR